ncbi:HET-domain-containing protein [Coniochaeta ligniaria NRRL 30616]|uniref:HET-domain-containing protein n=1 Tax=Coniochaeta ligniaria NRRL 30616 TaxID=1408157 RepID=A0A1J7JCL8_9PEZI|nr:HET-domain-containing protein [Coniochaeta ligniaria NRRL 30616]
MIDCDDNPDSFGGICRLSPTTLWLGQRSNTPFQEDNLLAAGSSTYEGTSSGCKWPTAAYTKAHRLHDIKTLCEACDRIDITALAEDGPPLTLRNSFFEIARTAGQCRFCSLIAQSARGVEGTLYEHDFLHTMGNRDAVDDAPVCLDLQEEKLNVRILFPEDGLPAEGMMDFSVPTKTHSPSTVPATINQLVSRLNTELQRVIKSSECQICASQGWHMDRTDAEWSSRLEQPVLPDRVIEILDSPTSGSIQLRLQPTQDTQTGHYIALSHRWGGVTLTTTKKTLPDHLKASSLDDLPRTFQDAVLVAKAMGIKYLWIDSLCIVQDNEQEWLEQSVKMGDIYMNSSFTITAHSAGQCNEGFLWRSQVSSALLIAPRRGGPEFLVSIPELDGEQLQRRFFESEISRRAWILQELSLSPRILHFVENSLIWECRHCAPQVQGTTMETTAAILQEVNSASRVHTTWLKLVQRYTGYQMTKSGDKLIALAGIVEVIRRMVERPEERQYHCGVFQTDIERSLLWYSSDKIERRLERAPSWSWASTNGTLWFLSLEEDVKPRRLMVMKRVQHEDYFDKTISQPRCQLMVEAPIIRITAGMVLEKRKRLRVTPLNAPRRMVVIVKNWGWTAPTSYGWCIEDEAGTLPGTVGYLNPGEPVTLSFLAVWGHEVEGELVGAWCVVVSLVDETPGLYRRIGLGYVRDVESVVFAMVAPKVITLV